MQVEKRERKQLIIFLTMAYGITLLMSIFMYMGLKRNIDLTTFVNTQMFYPACGVILAKMITRQKDEQLPTGAYICFLVGTVLMMALSVLTIFVPVLSLRLGGSFTVDQIIDSVMIIIVSIPVYIMFFTYGREAQENAGVRRKNIGQSAILILVFIVLFVLRIAIGTTIDGLLPGRSVAANWRDWFNALKEATGATDNSLVMSVWMINIVSLPLNFFFTFTAFFGEEYGWRYFFQPFMTKKFGNRRGVILLGLLWALWHICVDFMFYTTVDGPKMFVSQIITCVSVGIFFGYAYMKTQNIWVPVIMHYLNNNLAVLLGGGTDASALQNQSVSWADIPVALISSLIFVVFIFAKEYKGKNVQNEIGNEMQ